MARIPFTQMEGGMWLSPGPDKTPEVAWRRLTGVRPDSVDSLRSRWGSTLQVSENAHSIRVFNDNVVTGVGTDLNRDGATIDSSLSGDRLAFSVMQRLDSLKDFLYVAGGGTGVFPSQGTEAGKGDHLFIDADGQKVIYASGQFTTTVKDSEDLSATVGSGNLLGVEYDGTDVPWGDDDATEKLQLQSGLLTSTIKTSADISAVVDSIKGVSYDGTNTPSTVTDAGGGDEKLMVFSGQFSTTLKDSANIDATLGAGNGGAGTSFTGEDNWVSQTSGGDEYLLFSGNVTTTVKDSTPFTFGGVFGMGFDGADVAAAEQDSGVVKALLYSGNITSLIKTSLAITSMGSDIQQTANTNINARLGTVHTLPAQLIKVDSDGNVTRWGIAAPDTADSLAVSVGGGTGLTGTFKYKFTYKNSNSGHRSNPSQESSVTLSNEDTSIVIAATDLSDDSQVDKIEIWRTVAGGSLFFLNFEVEHEAQTVNDTTPDADLQALELPLDNAPPEADLNDCVGPHAGRMWWSRSDTATKKGRVFYSPIGRPESINGGTIILADDDDTLQKLVSFGSNLYAFSTKWIFQIAGTDEPFIFRKIPGAPGTIQPHSCVATPFGICYQAQDGVRIFNGTRSQLLGYDAFRGLFRGEDIEDYGDFNGVVAAFARGEYFISDTEKSFAYNLEKGTWREIGVGINAFYYDPEGDDLYGTLLGDTAKVAVVEDEGVVTDAGVPVTFDVETGHRRVGLGKEVTVQMLYVDCDTRGEILTPSILIDNVREDLVDCDISANGRQLVEIPLIKHGRFFGFRFRGEVSDQVEIFSVEAEVDSSS